MRYFVFIDHPDLLPILSGLAGGTDDQTVIKVGQFDCEFGGRLPGRILSQPDIDPAWIAGLNITEADRVVICAANADRFTGLVDTLSSRSPAPPILLLTEKAIAVSTGVRPNISVINVVTQVRNRLDTEWRHIGIRKKAYRLWRMLSGAGRVLIMTQNDPDPDAIASGMAVQALIDGDAHAAPIATLGAVTRNENLSMIRLLKTDIKTIDRAEIKDYDRIVMVDVQPPYFEKGLFPRVDAVIDHHPYPPEYQAEFIDVNVSYGATATMLCEYLTAGGISISERLATALLYGVITDTMLLARESSTHDFDAFSQLWPLANQQMLANMSRPRLDPEELNYIVRAIHNRRMYGSFLYIWLGPVKREDVIPRLADFSLQIGETTISAVCGVHEGSVIISIRNFGADTDAGGLASELFSRWGSAGGHRSMAKAIFPVTKVKKELGLRSMKQVKDAILKLFIDALPN